MLYMLKIFNWKDLEEQRKKKKDESEMKLKYLDATTKAVALKVQS